MRRSEEDDEGWLTTFGDLVTLLLTFFAMIFAISSFGGKEDVKEAMESIAESLGADREQKEVSKANVILGKLEKSVEFTEEEREKLFAILKTLLEAKKEGAGIEIKVTDIGLVVKAKNPVLFNIGKAKLKEGAYPILNTIAEIYKAKQCEFSVYGHTCDLPIHTSEFPTNWELSTTRALSVVHYFQGIEIAGDKLSGAGCADLYPVAPNTDEANRKLNRRVEIFIDFGSKEL